MVEIKLTQEQQKAKETENKNIIVTASAGSGKTAVLVERIISKLVAKKLELDKVLAITFTNDAASSLKSKIYDALLKEKDLQKELAKVSSAHIMTIDALCLDIAKKYYYKISGLDEEILNNKIDYIQEKKIKKAVYDELVTNYQDIAKIYNYKLFNILESITTDIYQNSSDVDEVYEQLKESVEKQYSPDYIEAQLEEIKEQFKSELENIVKKEETILKEVIKLNTLSEKIDVYKNDVADLSNLTEVLDVLKEAKFNKTELNKIKVLESKVEVIVTSVKNIEKSLKTEKKVLEKINKENTKISDIISSINDQVFEGITISKEDKIAAVDSIKTTIEKYKKNKQDVETLTTLSEEIKNAKLTKTVVGEEKAKEISEFKKQVDKLLKELNKKDDSGVDSAISNINENLGKLTEIVDEITLIRNNQYEDEISAKSDIESTSNELLSYIEQLKDESDIEKIKQVVEKIRNFFGSVDNNVKSLEEIVANIVISVNYNLHGKEVFLDVVDMSLDFYKAYTERKKEKKLSDYNDILRYAIEILNDEDVKNEYKDRYQEIYVDEFQDTNRIQDDLVAKLRGEDTSLFIVGDIKQSIYRFRNADPSIMKEYVTTSEENPEFSGVNLPHNFRSSKNIIEFNNILYEKMMNLNKEESEEKNFTDRDIAIAVNNPEDDVDITLIYKEKLPFEENEESGILNKTAREAVNFIVRDKNDKNYQNKDIAVLVATNAEVSEFKKEFERHNIPVYANSESSFYENKAVHTVLNFLKTIENTQDAEAWLYVLQSSMFELTYKEIAEIVVKNDWKKLNFRESLEYPAVKSVIKQIEEQSAELYKEDLNFTKLVYRLKYRPVSEIINFVYSVNNFYNERVSKTERGGLDRLIELANEKEYSLATFLDYMADFENLKLEDASPYSKNDDVIRIMTVHKSKGLEFKKLYVYIKNSDSKETGSVMYNKDKGLSLEYVPTKEPLFDPVGVVYETELYKNNQKENRILEFEETTRLLYVATTRAEEKLSVILNHGTVELNKTAINGRKKKGEVEEITRRKDIENIDELLRQKLSKDISKLDIEDMVEKAANGKSYILKSLHDDEKSEFTKPINLNRKTPAKPVKEEYDAEIIKIDTEKFNISNINLKSNYAISKNDDVEIEEKTNTIKAADRGTRIHKAIEKYHLYKETLDEALGKDDADKVRKLYENEEFNNYINHKHVFEELYYTRNESDSTQLNNNIIDFWADLGDKVVIVDFKTNTRLKTEAEFVEKYKDQLERYREYIQKQYPSKKVETYIYSLELEKMIEI